MYKACGTYFKRLYHSLVYIYMWHFKWKNKKKCEQTAINELEAHFHVWLKKMLKKTCWKKNFEKKNFEKKSFEKKC